ncbi:alpha/beta fold hydrolase [Tsukamurella sp. 8F]|uniref:alpha/beta fold hydrolase n=1 Tax=unclassified Tsukamurella TaxID=2633480 RepID=UPI0023B8D631|nr:MULTISPECIES: alpha/beta fold hydrolase [unclassified Tsukamurella]MDF0531266.1 alpha/beta fold hydrolase [Tsukamurella sp. 8J]MDF0585215.1 alpha/beta fold hydrolase [Tsukamurella sp. 8F]
MKLHVWEWAASCAGGRPPVAALLHGYGEDGACWARLAELLVRRGYRVVAPDLRGHGLSDRSGDYSFGAVVEDVLDTLPEAPDLAIGHSFGALVLGSVVGEWRPGKAVYLDPALTPMEAVIERDRPDRLPQVTEEQIRARGAGLHPADVQARCDANARLDPETWAQMSRVWWYRSELPAPPDHRDGATAALVIAASDSTLVPAELHDRLRGLGLEVRVAIGIGHLMHREDPHQVVDLMWGYC